MAYLQTSLTEDEGSLTFNDQNDVRRNKASRIMKILERIPAM